MRICLILLVILVFTGCATVKPTSYKDLNLDTTSNMTNPKQGKSGIYVYQWKSGIFGAAFDVDFEIKGQSKIPLSTGEYGYFELEPGPYEYKAIGGIFQYFIPVEFESNKNYFFRASISNAIPGAALVRDQLEIDQAKKNILTGRYEIYSKD